MLLMREVDLQGKRVLIREDFNVPIAGGEITDDTRLRAALPTIIQALDAGASVILVSHLGRPTEGERDPQFSLAPVAAAMTGLVGREVRLVENWLNGVEIEPGEIVLCQNVRFEHGEKANAEPLARALASLCDIFVNDAFATAHRAQASTHGVAQYAQLACAGPLLERELAALRQALEQPARPMLALVGGSKVSSKLELLTTLADRVEQLIVGGGIANTFLKAAGFEIGKSLCEHDLIDTAKALLAKTTIPLPTDVVCCKVLNTDAEAELKPVTAVQPDDMIVDIGPRTAEALSALISEAGTIVWNGPVGVFEFDQFGAGTRAISEAIASASGFSIAGGGDTLAAIAKYGVTDQISYISTGGGAFLEYLEGRTLPAVAILEERATHT